MRSSDTYYPSKYGSFFHGLTQHEALAGGAAGPGKAVDLDTEIPTVDGFSTMRDIPVGAVVFDEKGDVCNVVAKSEVWHGRSCYRVLFDDGSSIIADEAHEWLTYDQCERASLLRQEHRNAAGRKVDSKYYNDQREKRRLPQVRTTKEILETLIYEGKTNHCVMVAEQLNLPDAQVRKAAGLGFAGSRTQRWRYIVAVEAVVSRPTQCLQVDSPSHQFLIGRTFVPTHNSLILLMDPMQQILVEHQRCSDKKIQWGSSTGWALHLRREFPMLEQTIARSQRMFPLIDPGAKYDPTSHMWKFSSGYRFQFGHCKDENSWESYRSGEYCMARGSLVAMGDGTSKPIEDIRVGDLVSTLEGPRHVVWLAMPRRTRCVRADVYLGHVYVGTQIHPTTHPLLTSASASAQRRSQTSGTSGQSQPVFSTWIDYESLLFGHRESPGTRVSELGGGSDFLSFDGSPQGSLRLPALSVPVVLHGRTLRQVLASRPTPTVFRERSEAHEASRQKCQGALMPLPSIRVDSSRACGPLPRDYGCTDETRVYGGGGALSGFEIAAGFECDCLMGCCSCGGQPRRQTSIFRGCAPSQDDAASRTRASMPPGDPEQTLLYIRPSEGASYRNFYTKQTRHLSEDYALGSCLLTPVGEFDVFDIEVESANHYISARTGIVNLNTHVAFDELIQFTQRMYDEIKSRCRSSDPVLSKMLKVRAATNPGPGWVREYFVDPAPEGNKTLIKKVRRRDGTIEKRTRVFVPATLYDNPDPEFVKQYELTLLDLPHHLQRAQLHGDWYVVAGAFFAAEFDPGLHVIKPFLIPSGWTRFRSLDWGFKSWGVCLWWAVHPDGSLICEREYSFKGKTAREVALKIRDIELEAGLWDEERDRSSIIGPADTQISEQRGSSAPSIAEEMSSLGVSWVGANKTSRAANAQRVIGCLKSRHGDGQMPGLMFFDTCAQCRRTIPAIQADESHPEEPAKGGDDHWYDAVAYAVAYRAPRSDIRREWKKKDPTEETNAARAKRIKDRGNWGYGLH